MISKKVLEKLSSMDMPHGFCELRFPSVITGLGYSCANLEFPMVQIQRKYNIKDDIIINNSRVDIIHPVYGDYNE